MVARDGLQQLTPLSPRNEHAFLDPVQQLARGLGRVSGREPLAFADEAGHDLGAARRAGDRRSGPPRAPGRGAAGRRHCRSACRPAYMYLLTCSQLRAAAKGLANWFRASLHRMTPASSSPSTRAQRLQVELVLQAAPPGLQQDGEVGVAGDGLQKLFGAHSAHPQRHALVPSSVGSAAAPVPRTRGSARRRSRSPPGASSAAPRGAYSSPERSARRHRHRLPSAGRWRHRRHSISTSAP